MVFVSLPPPIPLDMSSGGPFDCGVHVHLLTLLTGPQDLVRREIDDAPLQLAWFLKLQCWVDSILAVYFYSGGGLDEFAGTLMFGAVHMTN